MSRMFWIFVASLVLAIAFMSYITHAMAAVATWDKQGEWVIQGDTEHDGCWAVVSYKSGELLYVLLVGEQVNLAVVSPNNPTIPSFGMKVSASTGHNDVLYGESLEGGAIVFRDIGQSTINSLIYAKSIEIGNLGVFDLTGSYKAIGSAVECYEALNSF